MIPDDWLLTEDEDEDREWFIVREGRRLLDPDEEELEE